MKHYFDTDGHEFPTPPDPYKGRSPMHKKDGSYDDDAFREMGGTITDDGELSPKEKFTADLTAYLDDLEDEAKRLGLDITVADFYAAASTMFSTELIEWATEQGVPPDMIEAVRQQMLVFIADASRIGLTWDDIFKVGAE